MLVPGAQSLLTRANAALERGLGAEAARLLGPLLRAGSLSRGDELSVRASLCQAWLTHGDLAQASAALGRPPDSPKDSLDEGLLSNLWRLHGHLALAKGDQSRAIALQTRAVRHAERAHDSRAIGLAHFELAHCYRSVGETQIVRTHLTTAAAALHAAGDRRHLALVHSLSGVLLAQTGRNDEAMSALHLGERLAQAIHADDVVARLLHNQANVALVRHEREQALGLAERSVAIYDRLGSGHGLSVALATLGQILVQLGDLGRAEEALTRSLDVRGQVKFHDTTIAVFDTLVQIHLMRGSYTQAEEYLRLARETYADAASRTSPWYEWSLRVLGVKLAIRRGDWRDAVTMADALVASPGIPAADRILAELSASEALVLLNQAAEARGRLERCEGALDPRTAPSTWAEFLRVRGLVHERSHDPASARHDFAQSATVFDLLGERYPAATSRLALGRLAAASGAVSAANRHLQEADLVFRTLGASRDALEVARVRMQIDGQADTASAPPDADLDEAVVRRLVEGALFPDLLAREVAATLTDGLDVESAVVFESLPDGRVNLLARVGCSEDLARSAAEAALNDHPAVGRHVVTSERLGRYGHGSRACVLLSTSPLSARARRRLSMFATIARQGFELCSARERHVRPAEQATERPLEPLLPGFICAGAVMNDLADQIQRLAGHSLTVLITGESGTGKDLVARAIHMGSQRTPDSFLPFNCTTASRELADSQLFGHRRGSFTGAHADQPGLIRSAAGGTLFLDEIGDLPIDVQPKLLRFLEQGEVVPVGETRPMPVDVRVLAATNVDLEQRVAEGRFREDLYYRLSVIRLHIPPLRERREEIPHLSTFFLREACERLARPDVHLSSATLDVFVHYWWPGNVRQLRNEIQRAVAMSQPGADIEPRHLSLDIAEPAPVLSGDRRRLFELDRVPTIGNLPNAIEQVERGFISATLDRSGGNISEAARSLGLTRRGLYLKMKRLGIVPEHASAHTR